jgi:hypothetical protein
MAQGGVSVIEVIHGADLIFILVRLAGGPIMRLIDRTAALELSSLHLVAVSTK